MSRSSLAKALSAQSWHSLAFAGLEGGGLFSADVGTGDGFEHQGIAFGVVHDPHVLDEQLSEIHAQRVAR